MATAIITAATLARATGLRLATVEAALRAATRRAEGDMPERLALQLPRRERAAAWRRWLEGLAGLPGPMPDRERLEAERPERSHRVHGPAAAAAEPPGR